MPRERTDSDFAIDSNGCLTERIELDGQSAIVHYDDVPESDITTLDGVRVTTPLRTVIDVAPDVDRAQLRQIVAECLARGLFTPAEALARCARPDMAGRPRARLLLQALDADR